MALKGCEENRGEREGKKSIKAINYLSWTLIPTDELFLFINFPSISDCTESSGEIKALFGKHW